MLIRIILGLGVTIACFAIAGRRFYWLSTLIRSGQSAPRRFQGFSRKIEAEVVEVAGQKKLLKWTVPGLAHFFTMWGFTILLLTIFEAYGNLFQRDFHIPLIGTNTFVGFIEDFFAVMVLVSMVVFSIIRLKNDPKRKDRSSRFYGSHTGAAWLVLLMISSVIVTLLVYRAAQVNTGNFPYSSNWAFASHGLAHVLQPLGTGVNSVIETVFLLLNVGVITGFLVFVAYSKHLHIFLAPINVGMSRRPRALGGLDKTPDMDMENVTEDTVFGVGRIEDFTWKQMLDFATCTECGRCQSVCPAWNTDKPLSPKLLIMGLRDNMFSEAHRIIAAKAGDGGGEAGEVQTLVPFTIDPDVLWSCTTCGSCVEQCPVDIEHVDA
ncbi:MAG: (Fe-S)-binding protein, partial [Actinomycetota bacterium]